MKPRCGILDNVGGLEHTEKDTGLHNLSGNVITFFRVDRELVSF